MCNKHPGEEIERLLKAMGMSRKELATRTDVTEKHINTLISGERNITVSFAKKLGYIFPVSKIDPNDPRENAKYWQSLQNDYDISILQDQEKNNITKDELNLLENLGDVVKEMISIKKVPPASNPVDKVLQVRNLLKISNLTLIPQIPHRAAYRAQLTNNLKIDQYVLFAWQALCDLVTENISVTSELNLDLLKEKLSDIKHLMFENLNNGCQMLQQILAQCGIAFNVVKHFRGAPVQGFIKKSEDNKLVLCLTIRGGRADTFWFTLFHEIAHVFYHDYDARFVDFDSPNSEVEFRADRWAQDFLIPPEKYKDFIGLRRKATWPEIESFANDVGVQPYIVLGRLQKDGFLEWTDYAYKVAHYRWAK